MVIAQLEDQCFYLYILPILLSIGSMIMSDERTYGIINIFAVETDDIRRNKNQYATRAQLI